MPSCDGSNCGACSACSTEIRKEYIHLDEKEREQYEKRILSLEKELKHVKGINEKLVERLLEAEAPRVVRTSDSESLNLKVHEAKQELKKPRKKISHNKKDLDRRIF